MKPAWVWASGFFLLVPAGAAAQLTVTADFSATPTSGCTPLVVQFTDKSTGIALISWSWRFGDGGTSTEQNPSHTYQSPGPYAVTLTVKTLLEEDSETKNGYITASGAPVAAFTGRPASGCGPLAAIFTDNSAGSVESWIWDFGDGGSSTAQNPTHSYQAPGAYDVQLTVQNSCGQDSQTKQGLITVLAGPSVDFSASTATGCAPLKVTFQDRSTGNGLDSWSWEFGDGGTSAQRSPSHIYQDPGVYSVKLTVRGTCGEDNETKTNLIRAAGTTAAAFAAGPTSGCAPLSVGFTDQSQGDGLSWSWDFGDGAKSSEQSPVHVYQAPGIYSVNLTVRGTCGADVENKSSLVRTQGLVAAGFSAATASGCAPLGVDFRDTSRGDGLSSWSWDFGDGKTSGERNPSHTYDLPGTYSVRLTVRGSCGTDVESKTDLIVVKGPPASPRKIEYKATGFIGDILSISWPRSGGAQSYLVEGRIGGGDRFEICSVEEDGERSEFSCSRILDEEGTWSFRVTARNDCGAASPVEGPVLEVAPPASFAFWPIENCLVEDTEKGNDGRFIGTVGCVSDRFGVARSAIQFKGTGFVEGSTLPPWDADFSVSLWLQPRKPSSGAGSGVVSIFEITPDDPGANPAIAPLRIQWSDDEEELSVSHGGDAIVFEDVARSWHHLVVSRQREELIAILDAAAAVPVDDASALGNGFTLGASRGGSNSFPGDLDEIRYESRSRLQDDVIALILAGGPTVLVESAAASREITGKPGSTVNALELRLRTGTPSSQNGFLLENLRLLLQDLTEGSNPDPSFPYIRAATLHLESSCAARGQGQEELVGRFALAPSTDRTGSLDFKPTNGAALPLPSESVVCLLVKLELSPAALGQDRSIRLDLKSADDLHSVDGDSRPAFTAGGRHAERSAVDGNLIHILNQPPELTLTVVAAGEKLEERSPVKAAELHSILLTAGTSESVKVAAVLYRPVADTTLDGVSRAALFADGGGGAKRLAEGVVDPDAGAIRFTDLSLEVPAGGSERLILTADLAVDRQAVGTVPASSVVLPGSTAGAAGGAAAMRLVALAFFAVFASFSVLAIGCTTRRFAARVCLRACAALPLAIAGCGPVVIGAAVGAILGSSGGGGGGVKGGPLLSQQFQVAIHQSDLDARGTTTGAPAVLTIPEPVVVGPLFELKSR